MTEQGPNGNGGGDWVHIRSPFVYWAQTEDAVSLRIAIQNAQNPKINIEENRITFEATGRGAQGENEYHFDLAFPHPVNPKASTYRVLDRDIDVILKKEAAGWWSKVTTTPMKPAWLKVDFDRWKSPDDEDEVPPDVMKDYSDLYETLKKDEFGYKIENMRTVYLFMYNLFQFVGYLYIVGVLSIRYAKDGPVALTKGFEFVGSAMKYCQFLQIMEVVHPLLGFTKTGVFAAVIQVLGRNAILFLAINREERVHDSPAVFLLFFVWSLAELTRYPYYMLQISKRNVYIVTWIRYSAWILLYPMGIAAEAILLFQCIPHFIETGKNSWTLPNAWNFTFYFPTLLRGYLLFGLIPISYALLMNMQRARGKALGSGTKTKPPRPSVKKSS